MAIIECINLWIDMSYNQPLFPMEFLCLNKGKKEKKKVNEWKHVKWLEMGTGVIESEIIEMKKGV